MEELEKQIQEILDTYDGRTELILEPIVELQGRHGIAHRTLRSWIYFIHEVIFEKEAYPQYKNFEAGLDDSKAIQKWAALYLHSQKRIEKEEIGV